jgi:hypothetical protein
LKALTTLTPEEVIASMKISDEYRSFRGVLLKKKSNENQAKNIITSKLGNLKYNDIRQIIELIDFAYPCLNKGKENKGPWFGRLLKSNTNNLFETDENKINDWFISLTNNYLSIENKFALLLNEPRCISGLNIGFLSLMLYLIDKKNNLVWFEGIHEGFRKLFPETEKYSGKVVQYMTFVDSAKIFAEKNGFEDTELDWIFSTGVYLDISLRRTDPFIFDKTKVSESAIRSSGPTIFEQIKEACVKTGSVVFSSEIKNLLEKKYGTNPSSVILSDYCYNRFCIGTHHGKYLFEHLAQGKFRYLGENYPYSGKIYNKPTGESEIKIIGEWKDGEKILERY